MLKLAKSVAMKTLMHSSYKSLRRLAAATLLACCVTVEAADLDTWELVNTQPKWTTLLDVGYANGTFVAVGQWFSNSPSRGTILTSPNGKDWTSRESHTECPLFGVTFGGNTFVAVGGRHTGVEWVDVILASPDATNWTVASENRTNYLLDVCYGNARFVAVGNRGAIRTSDDGWQWTDRVPGPPTSCPASAMGMDYLLQ